MQTSPTSAPSHQQSSWREAWRRFLRPVSQHKRELLAARWKELPPELQTDRQVVGRQMTHCGYTMGAAFCSFGCTHCYLPKNANSAPLPTLEEMQEQIDANHAVLGEHGALQITGGDVVDAYWKAGQADELVKIIRYATDKGLVPMLMTHGQVLLENPDYFDVLVSKAGLRKVAIHIDMTQAGRAGYPIKSLKREADLHPLRDAFVSLIEGVAQRTGRPISASHTVTVTEANLSSLVDIVEWFGRSTRNAVAFRMLSVQPEADVGRTRYSNNPVTPERVWSSLSRALNVDLVRDTVLFGHPDCSSVAAVLLRPGRSNGHRAALDLMPDSKETHQLISEILSVFGGVGTRGKSNLVANAQRAGLLVRHPLFLAAVVRYAWSMRKKRSGVSLLASAFELVSGRSRPISLVMHNFMSTAELAAPQSQVVEDRLAACSFKGAVKQNGDWVVVPMCSMNGVERERIYDDQIDAAQSDASKELVPLRRAS